LPLQGVRRRNRVPDKQLDKALGTRGQIKTAIREPAKKVG
jgi:hypothetical protein